MTETIEAVEVVITGPPEFVEEHCRRLVEDRLIACAQVGRVQSTYRWEGAIESETEARAALHTVRDKVDAVTERTVADHPYDVPCILVLPVQGGNEAYLRWVAESVRGAE